MCWNTDFFIVSGENKDDQTQCSVIEGWSKHDQAASFAKTALISLS
jgi:hypothetical protein